ncbi:hypothetical protein IE985_25370 [Klebsiella pneumoniae]|nr:hypothetical protein [Klebsiella pneumoniae]
MSAFHARYAGGGPGNQPFHPAMMVKVLIYGYASGVFSSRNQPGSCTRMSRCVCWPLETSRPTAR